MDGKPKRAPELERQAAGFFARMSARLAALASLGDSVIERARKSKHRIGRRQGKRPARRARALRKSRRQMAKRSRAVNRKR